MLVNKIKTAIVGASVVLAGCNGPASHENAKKYMMNKPQKELEAVIEHPNPRKSIYTEAYVRTQSNLDSVAYRDVFMATNASKDSSKVAEFNKIAAKGKMEMHIPTKKLVETNITAKEYNEILDGVRGTFGSERYYERIQYATDSINYRKFFDKHKLMTPKVEKFFNTVSKQIKP
ncbi:TPA: hypothetical protein CPT80_01265 [Candidatus Gastranaerophilales bacterium HUM_9]|nr:MAG TPA: hypothetical protein CPT80_01265 [Candidatus Gastranaerophilales bacterium HUM_9]HBX34590.1 hypothetical protein [Cyanobacteria bacterium UBA11440]